MSIVTNKQILVGVTGSIAAYKSVDLVSKLTQSGALVDVLLTQAAEKFVAPLTFQSVTGRKVYTDADLWGGEAHVLHVGLGQGAGLLAIAPATANTIAKLAHGMADNLVTITALAARCPILIAPAMDAGMYEHPATQDNIGILSRRGVTFAGPEEGRMASGLVGRGRFIESVDLMGHIRLLLGKTGRLAGKKVVVTAGGTQEPIDPVRFIGNRSSGRQGYALAQAALDVGATVILVCAPNSLPPPVGARLVPVSTAHEMEQAVLAAVEGAEALVMAAAVADFRVKKPIKEKFKKQAGIPILELEATADILQKVSAKGASRPRVVIGFAAESSNVLEHAGEKLINKKLDMIAANNITAPDAGFSTTTNRITLLTPDGKREELPLMGKDEAAAIIIERLADLLENK